MKPDGTNQHRIALNGFSPRWSPDGKRITFERGSNIWVMNANGSSQLQVTKVANNATPSFSPDGHYGSRAIGVTSDPANTASPSCVNPAVWLGHHRDSECRFCRLAAPCLRGERLVQLPARRRQHLVWELLWHLHPPRRDQRIRVVPRVHPGRSERSTGARGRRRSRTEMASTTKRSATTRPARSIRSTGTAPAIGSSSGPGRSPATSTRTRRGLRPEPGWSSTSTTRMRHSRGESGRCAATAAAECGSRPRVPSGLAARAIVAVSLLAGELAL